MTKFPPILLAGDIQVMPNGNSNYDNEFQRKYYSKNRDLILEKKKVYALKNKEQIAR